MKALRFQGQGVKVQG